MRQNNSASPPGTPMTPPQRAFQVVALAATVAGIIAIPLGIAFNRDSAPLSLPLDIALTLVFAVDAANTIRLRLGSLRVSGSGMLGIARMVSDVVAAVPWARMTGVPFLEALRLVKIVRLIPFLFMPGGENAANTSAMRIVGFAVVFGLTTHAITGLTVALDEPADPSLQTDQYVTALYATIGSLTSFDFGGTPENIAMEEKLLASGIMLVGLFAYAYLIGLFAHLLLNLDVARANRAATQEMLVDFLEERGVPKEMQQRVLDYHDYVWKRRHGMDESSVLADLPPSLRNEVSIVLKQDLISRIPFLEGADDGLRRELSHLLTPLLVIPGDEVVRKDEKGDCMFFVGSGELEVLDDEHGVFTTLGPGDLFGEMALISDARRTATVRAKDYCDLYRLSSHDFDEVIARHPDFAAHVYKLAEERKQ